MPRARKRARPIPPNYDAIITESKQKGKRSTLISLYRCLKPTGLDDNELKSLLQEIFDDDILSPVPLEPDEEEEQEINEGTAISNPKPSTRSYSTTTTTKKTSSYVSSKSRSGNDEHNEVCDVCEKGGDLLCCDTCSLVFHITCVRPKLPVVPKSHWSCAHCIADELAPGDMGASRRAISSMKKLSIEIMGRNAEDEKGPVNLADFVVTKSGKKYLVKKTSDDKVAEIGRFSSLAEAFRCLAPPSKSDRPANKGSKGGDLSDGKLWCTECIDDQELTVCCFCGCQECFGKHDSEYLLLCDNCDAEFHTYCLQPQLVEIPEDTWYCHNCSHMKDRGVEKEFTERAESPSTGPVATTVPYNLPHPHSTATATAVVKPPGRGRGRPPGSSRLARQQAEVAGGEIGPHGFLRPDGYSVRSRVFSSGMGLDDSLAIRLAKSKDTPLVVSIEAALDIVSKSGRGPLSAVDREVLQRLRQWGSRGDIQAVIAALREKRLELVEEVCHLDPTFDKAVYSADLELPIVLESQGVRSSGSRFGDFKRRKVKAAI